MYVIWMNTNKYKELLSCPFALHRKVEELVDDMLQKKVINLSKNPWESIYSWSCRYVQDFVWTIGD